MKNTLTKKELKESTFMTIGRLRSAIIWDGSVERKLALLAKISQEVEEMDLIVWRLKK